MKFLEKSIVALLSSVIFSLFLAFIEYTPIAEQEPGVGYFSFHSLLVIYHGANRP
ncbi:hypothetical protein [Gracilibacillus salinarum]|uniref:Uncharacterized protein n=1 Tax=Gracilibacillus salinarum TaxID=2932255 RepID=A0ABY4GKF8_9BACI|nr:hypothetical protein [Gracilibacillus salinarum]UOQ84678.1 hypothetical protein MUN87_18770 [Gracilibacillus salinarum]